MIGKILTAEYGVPATHTEECARILDANGRSAGLVRDIGGSPHVLLDGAPAAEEVGDQETETEEMEETEETRRRSPCDLRRAQEEDGAAGEPAEVPDLVPDPASGAPPRLT